MVTFGFYDSINHDRLYNARQFSSIFDGVVRDGIFMSIGDCFRVTPGTGMNVSVGTGRAWFDHTWTLNDAPLPLKIQQSEALLDRIDAVVLDVNGEINARSNVIFVLKGTPSNSPQRPTLTNYDKRHQHPLAYVRVRAGATEIRDADITSMIGTSETPYVTGILETVNIDALKDQWQDEWDLFYETQTTSMLATKAQWESQWGVFYSSQTSAIQEDYARWQSEWESWANAYYKSMNATAESWKNQWQTWFNDYTAAVNERVIEWEDDQQTQFILWFNEVKRILQGTDVTALAAEVVALSERVTTLENAFRTLYEEHAIYDVLKDNNNEAILDDQGNPIYMSVVFDVL